MPTKRRTLRFSPRATQDLEDIWLHTLQQWSLVQAETYVTELICACEALATGKKIGVQAQEIRPGYWKCFSGSHVLYYTQSSKHLDIVRILHQRRDVSEVF